MLIILFVVLIIITLVVDNGDIALFPLFLSIIDLIAICIVFGMLINCRTLDAKIAMYEEENTRIEANIQKLVNNYMEFEHSTFTECNTESAVTLVSLYPELKSDALVAKEIEIYTENNEEIKNLKLKLINKSNYKFWLYFGK